ncbi:hypothetical protein [Erysipelothrix larvae]|nr:hypothetical protein [Erysipelothrix larvae]
MLYYFWILGSENESRIPNYTHTVLSNYAKIRNKGVLAKIIEDSLVLSDDSDSNSIIIIENEGNVAINKVNDIYENSDKNDQYKLAKLNNKAIIKALNEDSIVISEYIEHEFGSLINDILSMS